MIILMVHLGRCGKSRRGGRLQNASAWNAPGAERASYAPSCIWKPSSTCRRPCAPVLSLSEAGSFWASTGSVTLRWLPVHPRVCLPWSLQGLALGLSEGVYLGSRDDILADAKTPELKGGGKGCSSDPKTHLDRVLCLLRACGMQPHGSCLAALLRARGTHPHGSCRAAHLRRFQQVSRQFQGLTLSSPCRPGWDVG